MMQTVYEWHDTASAYLPVVGYRGHQKLRSSLVEAQGYQRFPLSKPGVGPMLRLLTVRTSTYLQFQTSQFT